MNNLISTSVLLFDELFVRRMGRLAYFIAVVGLVTAVVLPALLVAVLAGDVKAATFAARTGAALPQISQATRVTVVALTLATAVPMLAVWVWRVRDVGLPAWAALPGFLFLQFGSVLPNALAYALQLIAGVAFVALCVLRTNRFRR